MSLCHKNIYYLSICARNFLCGASYSVFNKCFTCHFDSSHTTFILCTLLQELYYALLIMILLPFLIFILLEHKYFLCYPEKEIYKIYGILAEIVLIHLLLELRYNWFLPFPIAKWKKREGEILLKIKVDRSLILK